MSLYACTLYSTSCTVSVYVLSWSLSLSLSLSLFLSLSMSFSANQSCFQTLLGKQEPKAASNAAKGSRALHMYEGAVGSIKRGLHSIKRGLFIKRRTRQDIWHGKATAKCRANTGKAWQRTHDIPIGRKLFLGVHCNRVGETCVLFLGPKVDDFASHVAHIVCAHGKRC